MTYDSRLGGPHQWQHTRPHYHALIIDKDPKFGAFLGSLLTANNFSFSLAGSGEEGLERFNDIDTHIVITDMVLPGKLDGIAVIKSIKQLAPLVPTVAITGSNKEHQGSDKRCEEDAFLSLALMQGADAALSKPFNIEHFTTTLRKLLDKSQALPDEKQS
jgi:DNA-binding response OmpR family regulator